MESDLPESSDKRLNRLVAVTVVILSVFMGIAQVKDGNIVQAMQQAKTDSVDRWSEYQATRLKAHVAETARDEVAVLAAASPAAAAVAAPLMKKLAASIAKYGNESPRLQKEAKQLDESYDALNVHDDQFDASDALISIAISLAAVAALADTAWVLYLSWAFGICGLIMGIAGFAGWALHPDFLATLLS